MLKIGGYDADQIAAAGPIPVPYLDAAARAQYEVFVSQGMLCQKDGSGALQPMDTQGQTYMYVMDGRGTLYAGDDMDLQHHSSFLSGAPVAAAGAIRVASGQLNYLTDQSGHYAPSTDHTAQVLQKLRSLGVDLSQVQTDYRGMSRQQWAARGTTFDRYYPVEGVRTKPY
ncbi:hypothetical protein KZJ38_01825 [Paraburkholderia edwinii]|jgi:hypothetical protein|uniref:Cyclic nucleotide-binding domain-containing protein n=1 Tax=Paraburkholderia edwinii TaxID=2861782 RepID=A0ABX8UPE9_9BURK|nr:hypothetical protein [Paraburkholderia edwinii]QYD69155.1 hypothetical protein KZJ38_01825 [Paraburkholderia edwinii]